MPPEEAAACGSVPQQKSQYELDRDKNIARHKDAEECLRLQSLGAELGPIVHPRAPRVPRAKPAVTTPRRSARVAQLPSLPDYRELRSEALSKGFQHYPPIMTAVAMSAAGGHPHVVSDLDRMRKFFMEEVSTVTLARQGNAASWSNVLVNDHG